MRQPHTDRQAVPRPHVGYTGETVSLGETDPSSGDDNTCLGFIVIAVGVVFVVLCIGLSIVGVLALMGLQIQIVPVQLVPTATPLPR